ncbi:bifunctional riboflavin kinase/FAD synthetase [Salinibius halmophilus]|uniref:bifunctional riboflavin kinase/FAD synthetase n=1 Tax=Salinibius halmophilus TaxID=1853216 RepID=UPI000E6641B5|nr:bifunctional riboflavin kinase/FAD synthetase [Salinibius halmophilus]
MQLVRGLHNLPKLNGSVVTIGNFDGVHLGHRVILDRVVASAKASQLPSVVVCFEPQPREFFNVDAAPARIFGLRDKCRVLKQAGIDYLVVLNFTEKFRSLTAQQFVEQVLVQGLGVSHLFIGDDFRFGCDRSGDLGVLKALGEQFDYQVTASSTIQQDDVRVSSTRIRQTLAQSDLATSEQLLGHQYALSGRVVYGKQLGRTIGTPTINVKYGKHASPLAGVFAVAVKLPDGRVQPGVANIGHRPTVQEGSALEVHLLNFSQDLYGAHIECVFLQHIRDIKQFPNIAALQAQIAQDVQAAKQFFQIGESEA